MIPFFRRKSKNRRVARDVVLDVKLSNDQVRSQRVRLTARILSVLFALLAVGLVFWRGGQWLADRFLYENPAYTLKHVAVATNGELSPGLIQLWMGLKNSQNLYALDLVRVQRDLELVPWIKRVEVERVLPDTLRVRVFEREPVAQIVSAAPRPGGGVDRVVFHVDETGWVMPELDATRRAAPPTVPEVYPNLTGLPLTDARVGRRLDQPAVKAALKLVEEFEASPMAGMVGLAEIDVSNPELLRVMTTQHSEVFFAMNDLAQQIRRWRSIHDTLTTYGKVAANLDLSISNNVPSRIVEAANVPGVPPPASKPSRIKRRHV
jgi:cell division septal protein FtsQ